MILSPNRAHFGGSCAGTPRELFVTFFGIIAQTLRDIIAADWSDEIDAAWQELLGEIEGLVAAQCENNQP
ncbi:hypothetical protein [Bradyrhizobium sp. sGM-13]|uniref:hypothetical protein n=1 Tax=Bradyrhizobium sp. sGM-13 TaxID=2831781 RepID=UPI001BD1B192|nr:hypothetical protein [Bradyrhizobium sp. sGM-13]